MASSRTVPKAVLRWIRVKAKLRGSAFRDLFPSAPVSLAEVPQDVPETRENYLS